MYTRLLVSRRAADIDILPCDAGKKTDIPQGILRRIANKLGHHVI